MKTIFEVIRIEQIVRKAEEGVDYVIKGPGRWSEDCFWFYWK